MEAHSVLLTTAYWPPIHWLAYALRAQHVFLEACEHYQKGSYRNRCHIAGPNGVHRLSIPLLKGKHQQTPIRDVRLSDAEHWQRLHWRSIATAYGNAPFFEHYEAELSVFYQKRYTFLFDFNLECLQWLAAQWNISVPIDFTETFELNSRPTGVLDARNALDLAHPTLHTPRYGQVFEDRHGFLPNLSALDLLLCSGKTGMTILENAYLEP
ncbi:MAG: WbqC family protein [Saprospiraceae bacterium]